MPDSPEQVVREVGERLAQPRLGKDALVKLLKVTTAPSHPLLLLAHMLLDLIQCVSISRGTPRRPECPVSELIGGLAVVHWRVAMFAVC